MSGQTAPFLPAACTRCGAIFRSRLLSGVIVTDLTIGPGVPEQCPVCGGLAMTAEGVFNYTDHAIEVLAAPDVTLEMLRALNAVLQRTHAENLPLDEARRLAEAISPSFAKLFDPRSWSTTVRAAWIGVIGVALGAVLSAYLNEEPGAATVQIGTINISDLLAETEGKPTEEILAELRERLERLERVRNQAPEPAPPVAEPPVPRLKPKPAEADAKGRGPGSSE